jgi:hypothetical protein
MKAVMRPLAVALILAGVACGGSTQPFAAHDLTFLTSLTRGECPNIPAMRANLDAALAALGLPLDYAVVDLDTLPSTDPRTGYPIPTVLYPERDLFDAGADGSISKSHLTDYQAEFRPSKLACATAVAAG